MQLPAFLRVLRREDAALLGEAMVRIYLPPLIFLKKKRKKETFTHIYIYSFLL